MARKIHSEDEVLRSLSKKHDVRIYPGTKTIKMLSDKAWDKNLKKMAPNSEKVHDIGNGSWGRIDYLTKVKGYVIIYTDSFHKRH